MDGAGEDVARRGRTPPGNILISKIFAFVFKKRERSGGQATLLHPPLSRGGDKEGRQAGREGGRKKATKESDEGSVVHSSGSRDADGRWGWRYTGLQGVSSEGKGREEKRGTRMYA